MNASAVPSQARIGVMVKAASAASGVPAADVCFRQYRAAVRVRHGIWRELRSLGFGYTAIGIAWGCDHGTVHTAINGRAGQPSLTDRLAA